VSKKPTEPIYPISYVPGLVQLLNQMIDARQGLKLSQEETATALGVNRQTFNKWECGRSLPRLSNWLDWCRFLRVWPTPPFPVDHRPASTPPPTTGGRRRRSAVQPPRNSRR
jgi:DNA-binding XRE family transcriptional regulator